MPFIYFSECHSSILENAIHYIIFLAIYQLLKSFSGKAFNLKKAVKNPCQPRRGVIQETPGEAWGIDLPLASSLEEAECEQDA
ncbi:MAG: hypothetical protein IKX30_16595 [Victivallales bacterium]|nr:hypothetical protein [Victivallales bacterium]